MAVAAPSLGRASVLAGFLVSALIVGMAFGAVRLVRMACRRIMARAGDAPRGPLVVVPCVIQRASIGIMPVVTFFVVQLVLTKG